MTIFTMVFKSCVWCIIKVPSVNNVSGLSLELSFQHDFILRQKYYERGLFVTGAMKFLALNDQTTKAI